MMSMRTERNTKTKKQNFYPNLHAIAKCAALYGKIVQRKPTAYMQVPNII